MLKTTGTQKNLGRTLEIKWRCPIHGFYAEKCRKWQNKFTEKLFRKKTDFWCPYYRASRPV
jgi:hypothetical protein